VRGLLGNWQFYRDGRLWILICMFTNFRNQVIAILGIIFFLIALLEGISYLYTLNQVQAATRWGVRFAVTDVHNNKFCADAAKALNLVAADTFNGDGLDCKVPHSYQQQKPSPKEDTILITQKFHNWARLPSIRDEVIAGISRLHINLQESGDYLAYLKTHESKWLGNPEIPGYLHVTICSRENIVVQENKYSLLWDDNLPRCFDNTNKVFMDDPGEARNRVKVVVYYTYTPVTLLFRFAWPTIPIIASSEGIVEFLGPGRIVGIKKDTSEPTPSPSPTITPMPKNWLGYDQGQPTQKSTLSFIMTVFLIGGGMGLFVVSRVVWFIKTVQNRQKMTVKQLKSR
jgi:hypothetical protein